MADVLFYHLERQPLERVLPVLLEKTLERGWRAAVQTASQAYAEALDGHLWTYREDSFLPHGLASEQTRRDIRSWSRQMMPIRTGRRCALWSKGLRCPMGAAIPGWSCCSMAGTKMRLLRRGPSGKRRGQPGMR